MKSFKNPVKSRLISEKVIFEKWYDSTFISYYAQKSKQEVISFSISINYEKKF